MMADTITKTAVKPRLSFIGTGWIGLNRMKSLVEADACIPTGIYDSVEENAIKARESAEGAIVCSSMDELFLDRPDGIVIATPNAFHYEQCMAALNHGIAVFCQKPLARTATECKDIIETAQKKDKLLGVDMSYRYTRGMQEIFKLVRTGELGEIFAVDLVFHNAYGPDKDWFYNPRLSGGGCVIDLGIHLVDLVLWVLNFPELKVQSSSLYSGGKKINNPETESEDFASVKMEATGGTSINLTCSWNLNAGKDAEIKAAFYGTRESAIFKNMNGSFYDFQASLLKGTSSSVISSSPDNWGGRALSAWTTRLRESSRFDEEITSYGYVAEVIDKIYER